MKKVSPEELELILQVKKLQEQNINLRTKVEYYKKFEDIAKRMCKFMSYLRKAHSENISSQATKLFADYWTIGSLKAHFEKNENHE